MRIVANGEPHEVEPASSVGDFLRRAGLKPTQVVVEHNGRVLRKDQVDSAALSDGDRLEIIVPVAGG